MPFPVSRLEGVRYPSLLGTNLHFRWGMVRFLEELEALGTWSVLRLWDFLAFGLESSMENELTGS